MFELKPIALDALPRALAKAERYRLLNEPREAESIARDCLAVDADHQDAIVALVLAITDLFAVAAGSGVGSRSGNGSVQVSPDEARTLVARLSSEFDRAYYAGVVEERWAKALLDADYPHGMVFRLIQAAMQHFDAADRLAPSGNDDAALRWNSCVRIIRQNALDRTGEAGEPIAEADGPNSFTDDVPVR